ncbi:MAG TPA: MMPL family transporter [Ruminiclostridium sp.]|nr:MMPL family transporter [Ruminiclostridium sp.]
MTTERNIIISTNKINITVTSFTQMFIILVLFGIGTDYHILLFNRFKEELGNGLSVNEAIITSYKTAGKTIIFSGLTVFMGFASLSFVTFPVYRSANSVAIGIAVLLVEIMTFTPLLMKLLAGKLFWPSKHSEGHKESRLWERISSASVNHPAISIFIVILILVPVMILTTHKLSFDNIKDLSSDNPSVKGFNIVADKFGSGKAMPTTVVIESNEPMDNNGDLAILDTLTEKLRGLKGVREVSGPTRPKGEMINELYTSSQTKTVANGLSDANGGVGKIKDGLDQIESKLSTPDFSKVKDLSTGTGSLETGMTAISQGLVKINGGIAQGAGGADKLAAGIAQVRNGLIQINQNIQKISSNVSQINSGYTQLGQGYKKMASNLDGLKQLAAGIQASVNKVDGKLPNDPDVAALKTMAGQLSAGLNQFSQGLTEANNQFDQLSAGLAKLNGGLAQLTDATGPKSQLVTALNDLEKGAKGLSDGLKQGSAGQQQVIDSMAKLKAGASKIKDGQNMLYDNLNTLGSGMTQLKNGINSGSKGLGAISDGINKSSDFLSQLSTAKSFYIPKEAFGTNDINKMLDAYMSKDRKIAKLTVVMDSEPYSDESINLIGDIKTAVGNQLKGTDLASAKTGVTGPTANSYDLRNIATHDINFTQIIVLAAIFILLIIVIRDLLIPLYIVGSLMAAYYAALSATSLISKLLFASAKEGLSWNVPFFSFIMIAALGVDYSIFFMTRYKEYPNLSPEEAVITAAKNIGGVVISAAVILAGTFATLYPSNIVVLMELAICVVIGLFLLSFVLLPAAIPALMSLADGLAKKKDKQALKSSVAYEMK